MPATNVKKDVLYALFVKVLIRYRYFAIITVSLASICLIDHRSNLILFLHRTAHRPLPTQ